ncbi:enoyl-CoA hydratase/isomerase family protein [Telluribacter sp. SYSU D00476]|uniref:enoyl-CoA hydratase/isomerase family protein n=1 Tax=Telluribacter sp. SYSU D00476 TaxID=2811430 RepID=UPI001FF2E785|nr:enoyl-CoA hydratase-related protein [Telluribacter sp. SYSU D00476]
MRFYTKEDIQAFNQISFNYIKATQDGHVFRITLNRPVKRNAFTPTMAQEITYALAYAHYSDDVWCVVVDAEGPVFCAGADLNAFHDPTIDQANDGLPTPHVPITLGDAFADLSKPCIAQVEGAVLAGGFLIIAGCTFVVSVPEATFGLPEVKRGIWPMQVMASLLRIMPPRKVLEICITGKSFSADEALSLGLVTQVVENTQIKNEVAELARQICQNAPLAIKVGMETFNRLFSVPEEEKHTFLKAQLNKVVLSEDAKEGIAAFREKRQPNWKGK